MIFNIPLVSIIICLDLVILFLTFFGSCWSKLDVNFGRCAELRFRNDISSILHMYIVKAIVKIQNQ